MKPLAAVATCLLLSACSSPTQAPLAVEISKPVAPPLFAGPDSLPCYFPNEAGRNANPAELADTLRAGAIKQTTDCYGQYDFAAACLAAFKAPVLRADAAGPATYRFTWLRSFGRPVLLTLQCRREGATLYTQFLNKLPGITAPTLGPADTLTMSAKARLNQREYIQILRADTAFMARFRAEVAFAKEPMRIVTSKPVLLAPAQVQQFESLLNRSKFWQLASCQPKPLFDGDSWFLEAREPHRYHVVYRHSPEENEPFRQCCEFLLNLSPAKGEERY